MTAVATTAGLVSVALCTYNGARYLDAQLASVSAQVGVALEIVAVDDASTDDTPALLARWAAREPRLRVFHNSERLGFARNFEVALGHCSGEWIAPCDQDDVWFPHKLSALLAHAGDAPLVYSDSQLIDETGAALPQRISDRFHMYDGDDLTPLCFWNSVSGHAMLLHRRLLAHACPFPDVEFHDWWLAAVAAAHGGVRYVAEPLVGYRQHIHTQTDVSQRQHRPRQALLIYQSRKRWLARLALLAPARDEGFLQTLSGLWAARERQWFCPTLARHLWSRRHRVMRLNRREPAWRFVLKQFLGHRWRLLGRPSTP